MSCLSFVSQEHQMARGSTVGPGPILALRDIEEERLTEPDNEGLVRWLSG